MPPLSLSDDDLQTVMSAARSRSRRNTATDFCWRSPPNWPSTNYWDRGLSVASAPNCNSAISARARRAADPWCG